MRTLWLFVVGILPGLTACSPQPAADERLQVILIPADGGTEDGTKGDYQPIFSAVSRMTGYDFELRAGQAYAGVVEAMCNGSADIAFVGPVTYLQARERGCAELLAVAVEKGQSIYYSGLFTKADSPIRELADLKGKRVAFGDVNSTSSFVFPMTMIMEAGIDPARDLGAIRMTASHVDSLAALVQGQADVAALSFDSYGKAVGQGAVDPATIRVVARSIPIPYPPLIMSTRLPQDTKAKLREAFGRVHQAEGVKPEMIRGYGGKQVDRYDSAFPAERFDLAAVKMAELDEARISSIVAKASEQ